MTSRAALLCAGSALLALLSGCWLGLFGATVLCQSDADCAWNTECSAGTCQLKGSNPAFPGDGDGDGDGDPGDGDGDGDPGDGDGDGDVDGGTGDGDGDGDGDGEPQINRFVVYGEPGTAADQTDPNNYPEADLEDVGLEDEVRVGRAEFGSNVWVRFEATGVASTACTVTIDTDAFRSTDPEAVPVSPNTNAQIGSRLNASSEVEISCDVGDGDPPLTASASIEVDCLSRLTVNGNVQLTVPTDAATRCTEYSGSVTYSGGDAAHPRVWRHLRRVGGIITLKDTGLTSLEGFQNLEALGGLALENNSALTNVDGIAAAMFLPAGPGDVVLDVAGNPALGSLDELVLGPSVGGSIKLRGVVATSADAGVGLIGNASLSSDALPSGIESIGGDLIITEGAFGANAGALQPLTSLTTIEGVLQIDETTLDSLDGLSALTSVGAAESQSENSVLIRDNPQLITLGLTALADVRGRVKIERNNIDSSGLDGFTFGAPADVMFDSDELTMQDNNWTTLYDACIALGNWTTTTNVQSSMTYGVQGARACNVVIDEGPDGP